MAKSQQTFNKKELEKKKRRKKEEKLKRKEERKKQPTAVGLENMMAYVDEYGNIVDTPPDQSKPSPASNRNKIDADHSQPQKAKVEYKGKLVYYNQEKAYGFIKNLRVAEKVFAHQSEFLDEISLNDFVVFETQKDERGTRAIRIRKA